MKVVLSFFAFYIDSDRSSCTYQTSTSLVYGICFQFTQYSVTWGWKELQLVVFYVQFTTSLPVLLKYDVAWIWMIISLKSRPSTVSLTDMKWGLFGLTWSQWFFMNPFMKLYIGHDKSNYLWTAVIIVMELHSVGSFVETKQLYLKKLACPELLLLHWA